jgi:hypothetical protein
MADMKPLVLLTLVLCAASCFRPEPYAEQRPPYRNGEPYYPYAPGGQPSAPEVGAYEPVPGTTAPTTPPPAPPETRPALPEPRPAPIPRPSYPVARTTDQPGRVLSPYAPYNVIDVEGFESGALAKDPSNGKIFRVP